MNADLNRSSSRRVLAWTVFFLLAAVVMCPAEECTATVAASSGVNLRRDPSLDGKKLRKISGESPVTVLGRSSMQDNIEGKTDYWFKVQVENTRGWMFGAFLRFQQENERAIVAPFGLPMMETGEFHNDEIEAESGEEWIGLFPEKQEYLWKKVKVGVSLVQDQVVDSDGQKTGKRVTVPGGETPLFLLKDMEIPSTKPVIVFSLPSPNIMKSGPGVSSDPGSDNILHAGTEMKFTLGSETSLLRVETRPWNGPEGLATEGVVLLIRGDAQQEILKIGNFHPEEPEAKFLQAGDFDGDGKLDLLLDESNHYNMSSKVLFLSSRAGKGELVRRVAFFQTIGC